MNRCPIPLRQQGPSIYWTQTALARVWPLPTGGLSVVVERMHDACSAKNKSLGMNEKHYPNFPRVHLQLAAPTTNEACCLGVDDRLASLREPEKAGGRGVEHDPLEKRLAVGQRRGRRQGDCK